MTSNRAKLAKMRGLLSLWRMWRSAVAILAIASSYCVIVMTSIRATVGDIGRVEEHMEPRLWAVIVSAAILAGLMAAYITRRVAFWETLLGILSGSAVLFLQGQFDILRHLGLSSRPSSNFFITRLLPRVPGAVYFGNSWIRLLLLATLVAILCAIFSASSVHVFRGAGFKLRGAFESWVGMRYLMAKRRDGFISSTALISVLGVGLGVASLIAVTSVMSGYQHDVTERILDSNAHLVIQRYGIDFEDHEAIIAQALLQPDVLGASAFVFNEAMLATDQGLQGIMLKGIDSRRAGSVTNLERQLLPPARLADLPPGEDSPDGSACLPGLLVGTELLKELDLSIGEVVSLTTPVGFSRIRGNAPRRMRFRIAGVFRSGIFEFDQKLVYADLPYAQRFMALGDTVTGIELRVSNPHRVGDVSRRILAMLKGYPYRTLDWREMNAGIFTALRVQKVMMFLVLTFIIIVAAFNIASTLFMVVVEKSEEIALLKSIGARDESIMKTFMTVGWTIGLTGTGGGIGAGLLIASLLSRAKFQIAAEVYLVDSLSVQINPLEVLVTAASALVISHLATIYPALQAARVRPAEGLRYE